MAAVSRPLFFDRRAVRDFDSLVAAYEPLEFASPFRSTNPLLALIKDGPAALDELAQRLGIPPDANMHFEYKVQPARGQGLPSQTDLMVIAGHGSWAIEAKWTEPRYETVEKRIGRDPNATNRREVAQGWLDLIQPRSARQLDLTMVEAVVYQMVHRAASACAASANPALVYLVFHPNPVAPSHATNFYKADLQLLYDVLGRPADFPFYLVNIEVTPTPAFREIESLPKGKDPTAERVRRALLSEKLFAFGVPTLTAI